MYRIICLTNIKQGLFDKWYVRVIYKISIEKYQ